MLAGTHQLIDAAQQALELPIVHARALDVRGIAAGGLIAVAKHPITLRHRLLVDAMPYRAHAALGAQRAACTGVVRGVDIGSAITPQGPTPQPVSILGDGAPALDFC